MILLFFYTDYPIHESELFITYRLIYRELLDGRNYLPKSFRDSFMQMCKRKNRQSSCDTYYYGVIASKAKIFYKFGVSVSQFRIKQLSNHSFMHLFIYLFIYLFIHLFVSFYLFYLSYFVLFRFMSIVIFQNNILLFCPLTMRNLLCHITQWLCNEYTQK